MAISGMAASSSWPRSEGREGNIIAAPTVQGAVSDERSSPVISTVVLSTSLSSIIVALAEFRALGNTNPLRTAVAARLSCTVGHLNNQLSKLKKHGFVECPCSTTVAITNAGLLREEAQGAQPPTDNVEAHRRIKANLNCKQKDIFDILANGKEHQRKILTEILKVGAGHLNNLLSGMRAQGILGYPNPTSVQLTNICFPVEPPGVTGLGMQPTTSGSTRKASSSKKRKSGRKKSSGKSLSSKKSKRSTFTSYTKYHGDEKSLRDNIISALGQIHDLHMVAPETYLAKLVGYTSVDTKSYRKEVKRLCEEGLIEYSRFAGSGASKFKAVALCPTGIDAARQLGIKPPQDNNAVQERMKDILLTAKAKEMFDLLRDGRSRTRDEVCTKMGHSSQESKGFSRSLSMLKQLGIVCEDATKKMIWLANSCFPFGFDVVTGADSDRDNAFDADTDIEGDHGNNGDSLDVPPPLPPTIPDAPLLFGSV